MSKAIPCLLLALSFFVYGCLPRDPIRAWQHRVERQIQKEGNGDPTILVRDMNGHGSRSLRPGRVIVGELNIPGTGVPPLAAKRDVQAVLLGRPRIGSDAWFVFLAGVVKHQPEPQRVEYYRSELEDIRLICLAVKGRRMVWRISPADPVMVQTYLAGLDQGVVEPVGRREASTYFPNDTDVFQLTASEHDIVALAKPSGATWTLDLTQPP